MRLKKEIESYLSHIGEDCYKKHCLQLNKLCKNLNIKCLDAAFKNKDISGIICRENEKQSFVIYVNKDEPILEKRFTVAHEIGHFISAICNSHSKKQLFKDGFQDLAISFRQYGFQSIAEKEANLIAMSLLMPEKAVEFCINNKFSIKKIASLFFVSESAAAIRLYNLGIKAL